MHTVKHWSIFLLIALLLTGAAGCAKKEAPPAETEVSAPQSEFITIATGGTSSTYYPLGKALADIINSDVAGLNAIAATSGASLANVQLLQTGEAQMAFVQNDIAFYAATGAETWTEPAVSSLRGLATLYPETCQFVALKDSGITSIADLKEKRVAVGATGSGTEANARQILAAHGLSYSDLTPEYLVFGEAATRLIDGSLDVALVTAGYPAAAISEISADREIVILPVTPTAAGQLIGDYPFYSAVVIPAGTYNGQTEDVAAVAVKALLAVDASLSEDTAYDILTAWFAHLDTFKAAHPAVTNFSAASAQESLSVELHPGAVKFYAEQK
jgi:TRAP transporter TAXI family solute receptor